MFRKFKKFVTKKSLLNKFLKKRSPAKNIPKFKRGVNPKEYSFSELNKWVFKEKRNVNYNFEINPFLPGVSKSKHLILHDKKKVPRFVLAYDEKKSIDITILQRERTKKAYKRIFPFANTWFYRADKETRLSQEFGNKLGVHPSEFLLAEFVYRHRSEIMQGKKIRFIEPLYPDGSRNLGLARRQGGVRDRYFSKGKKEGQNLVYELSLKKKRVKEILNS